MTTRGEKQYIKMPVFAAKLYDSLTGIKGVNKGFEEIAKFVKSKINQGKLLDIGTGPGRLLYEINKQNPQLVLYGLDISESMLQVAKRNLQAIKNVELSIGNIVNTDYSDDFFDCIVSTGSFYNWDNPVAGLNEIFRILKKGKTAYIFESTKDIDRKVLISRLNENLKDYSFIRKRISKYFLMKQLRMTYTIKEFNNILKQTDFKNIFKIEHIELGNLPIYVRLELLK